MNILKKVGCYYKNGKKIMDIDIFNRINKLYVLLKWKNVRVFDLDISYLQVIGEDEKGRL